MRRRQRLSSISIFYGILDRYPQLKLVIVENEIGWIPFFLQQWDYYYRRFRKANPPPITREPSEYFNRQVYATFFNDAVGGHNFELVGRRTTACGPTTTRTPTRPGRTRAR